jgi:hypothetical protein
MESHGPMTDSGGEIDPVSGFPTDVTKDEESERTKQCALRHVEKYQSLINDLSGNGGEVLRAFVDKLVKRINHLIDTDPEAKAIKEVLDTIIHNVNYGEKIVNAMIQDLKK